MQKKAFRIEQMLAQGLWHGPDARADAAPQPAAMAVAAETAGLRNALERAQQALQGCRHELGLLSQRGGAQLRRAGRELGAVTVDTEAATQKVLDNAEAIDDAAKTLAAALKNEHNQTLAQDIQEHVTRIYEACNFQDLIGQRIANALTALRLVEAQIAGVAAALDGGTGADAPQAAADALINGPRLPGDRGHATQREIDSLFG